MENINHLSSGVKFEDGSSKKLFVSVVAKNAGAYVVRNSSDTDEFHGTGMYYQLQKMHNRLIMSVQKGIYL